MATKKKRSGFLVVNVHQTVDNLLDDDSSWHSQMGFRLVSRILLEQGRVLSSWELEGHWSSDGQSFRDLDGAERQIEDGEFLSTVAARGARRAQAWMECAKWIRESGSVPNRALIKAFGEGRARSLGIAVADLFPEPDPQYTVDRVKEACDALSFREAKDLTAELHSSTFKALAEDD